jgi:DNA-binding NarL/FixJ family response regulator
VGAREWWLRAALVLSAPRAVFEAMRADGADERQEPAVVLVLLAEGYDNGEIAGRLYVSSSTVKNHVSRVLEKLGLDNRVQAAAFAIRAGIADSD